MSTLVRKRAIDSGSFGFETAMGTDAIKLSIITFFLTYDECFGLTFFFRHRWFVRDYNALTVFLAAL